MFSKNIYAVISNQAHETFKKLQFRYVISWSLYSFMFKDIKYMSFITDKIRYCFT